jgi:hypothetical protein
MHPAVFKAITVRIEVLQQQVADSRFKYESNFLSPGRKARKGFLGDNKQVHEVPGVPGAFARKKQIYSRQGAKHAKALGVKTK